MTKKHEPIPVWNEVRNPPHYAGPFHKRYGDKQHAMIRYRYRCDCGTERDVTISPPRHKPSRPSRTAAAAPPATEPPTTGTPRIPPHRPRPTFQTRCYNRKAGHTVSRSPGVAVSRNGLQQPHRLTSGASRTATSDPPRPHRHARSPRAEQPPLAADGREHRNSSQTPTDSRRFGDPKTFATGSRTPAAWRNATA